MIDDVAFIGQLAESTRPDGPLFEVAVIHHTQCGTGALADDTSGAATPSGSAPTNPPAQHAVLDPEATVTRDVERVRSAEEISPHIEVSGHVYDVVTGLVETVIPADHSKDGDFQGVSPVRTGSDDANELPTT